MSFAFDKSYGRRSPFVSVQEPDNEFLKLFPHRFDYLYAPHPKPGQQPEWATESRHPLGDRLLLQGQYLYGVRFGPETRYGLLDIDKGSPYHPKHDPNCLERIFAALEPLGLVDHLTITSSASGGLHIYLPFEQPLPSWKLAVGICALLEKAGFKIMAGWLEVFPNQKPFSADGSISLYNGHRLPMQQGSYLLNKDLQPSHSDERTFTRQWKTVARRNDICERTLTRIIKQYRRRQYRITGKADKFLNDLNAEIELGWSGPGQTNRLLGRIAMRSYIFAHVLNAPAPLTGSLLVKDIVDVAKNLPGYTDYCGHQHEIEKRATEWARAVEKSNYFHYGTGKPTAPKDQLSWNEQQRLAARDRLRDTVIALLKANNWPEKATARFDTIRATSGISGTTLYKNKDLWHPVHLEAAIRGRQLEGPQSALPVENPPDPPSSARGPEEVALDGAILPAYPSNLLGAVGCNPLSNGRHSPTDVSNMAVGEGGVRNTVASSEQGVDGLDNVEGNAAAITDNGFSITAKEDQGPPQQLVLDIQATLQRAQQAEAILKAQRAEKYRQQRQQQAMAVHRAELEAWLQSGDPVLEAEARQQLRRLEAREEES